MEFGMHPPVKPTAMVVDAIKECSHRGGGTRLAAAA